MSTAMTVPRAPRADVSPVPPSPISGYGLARKAQRAAGGADQDRVLGLAQAATRVGTPHPQVLAFAALQRSHGHALAGETYQFETAVGQARTLIDGRTRFSTKARNYQLGTDGRCQMSYPGLDSRFSTDSSAGLTTPTPPAARIERATSPSGRLD